MRISAIGGSPSLINQDDIRGSIKSWFDSLKESNYALIGVESTLTLDEFFSDSTKKLYAKFKDKIDIRFQAEEAKKKGNVICAQSYYSYKTTEWRAGYTRADKGVKVISETYDKAHSLFQLNPYLYDNLKGHIPSKATCVGWKVTDLWESNTNGEWECITDPLTSPEGAYEFYACSRFGRGVAFRFDIYYFDE